MLVKEESKHKKTCIRVSLPNTLPHKTHTIGSSRYNSAGRHHQSVTKVTIKCFFVWQHSKYNTSNHVDDEVGFYVVIVDLFIEFVGVIMIAMSYMYLHVNCKTVVLIILHLFSFHSFWG